MAVTYTTAVAVQNRVESMDVSLTTAMIEEYIYQAESMINCAMGVSLVSSFDADKHKILSAAAQCWAAVCCVQFNPAGFTTLAEATFIADSLWEQWMTTLEFLGRKDVIAYLENL